MSIPSKHNPIVLVPTMGCLHEGHLSLVKKAKEISSNVIVSIFVNPMQFGPNEDFNKYPRTLEEDLIKLEPLNVEVFTPSVAQIYPEGFSSKISVSKLGDFLCGRSRPGHFDGVTTVVFKLFQLTNADFAVFGEKDFQQLKIIEKMCSDLNLKTKIISMPIYREQSGLAMSSRNRYLSENQLLRASFLYQALQTAKHGTVKEVKAHVEKLLAEQDLAIDYIEVCSSQDLIPKSLDTEISKIIKPRLFAAVYCEQTRLIDNISL
jgi:pantoate--beta-alanine ligase